MVSARNAGSSASYEAYALVGYTITAYVLYLRKPDDGQNQSADETLVTVKFTATASGGVETTHTS